MSRPLKIIALPVDEGGCGWYRIRQPFDMIQHNTDNDCYIVDARKDDMVEVAKALLAADVIVCRPGSERGMQALLDKPEYKDKPWVLDIDDNTEAISPYNFHYQEYGTEEYYDKNLKKWLHKDGVDHFDLKKNRDRIEWLRWGMRKASLVTVTTPKLAEYAATYNRNVAVLPNCINFKNWWKLPLKPNKQLRVGWAGGVSHYEDWFSIKEPLNELMRKYQFTLVFIGTGDAFRGVIDEDNRHLVEYWGWVPFQGHSFRMMALNLDIALVPLEDLPFNHYKSAVKWYEMSAMGIPSVVAAVTPYEEEIDLDLASPFLGAEGFQYALEELLTKPAERIRIGSNAQTWVQENRDSKKNVELWVDAYRSII